MQVALCKTIPRLRYPKSPPSHLVLFHCSRVSLAKWKSKWDDTKVNGSDQQPSKPYVRYAVRQKRAHAKRALKNLLDGKPSRQYFQDEDVIWYSEEAGNRNAQAEDGFHDFARSRKSRKSKAQTSTCSSRGKYRGNKRWQNTRSFYDEDCYQQHDTVFTATFYGQRGFTWSYRWWDESSFQSSTTGFEWRDDSKWEKTRTRVWSESDVDDEPVDIGSHSQRVALGLPLTGPLKLDDVKCAFRATALKCHPDKHQGPSQAVAAEKFKLCVDAYNSLCSALKST